MSHMNEYARVADADNGQWQEIVERKREDTRREKWVSVVHSTVNDDWRVIRFAVEYMQNMFVRKHENTRN